MDAPETTEGCGPCESETDRGKLIYDTKTDIWYECIYDSRKQEYLWAIVPSAE